MISNIEEIKAAINIIDIIGKDVNLKHKGSDYEGLCPFHNEKTPSFKVSPSKDLYKCFGCGVSGDGIQFLMDHDNLNYIEAIKFIANFYNISIEETDGKNYDKPLPRLEKVSKEAIKYFEGRGISNNTLLTFKITEAIEFMPKAGKEVQALCFNYFKDGELVNIKYRAKDKDFKLAKNAELIFYNLDALKGEKSCIIVEGEIDCLSLYECGFTNVVSVPNGAAKGNMQLNYLDNCWNYFEGIESIYLMTDNDNPGNTLREELARRLGKDRCYKIEYPDGCKDANEVLLKYNKQVVKDLIYNAKRWPIDGIITMDSLYTDVIDYYENGYPKSANTGICNEFDDLLTFSGGLITTITGIPNSGKSEFIDLIVTSLARRHGWKFGVCSPENPPAIHVTKLMQKFIGKAFDFRKNPDDRINRSEFEEAIGLTDMYFSFINILQVDISIEGLLNKFREVVLKTGIKGIVIDPWNYLEHKVPPGYTETQYISEALTLIKEFAIKNDVHIFLIAHPKKLVKDAKGHYPVATMYDISGSAHFFNKTDNGISVFRNPESNITDVHVQKVRFEWMGKIGFTSFTYDTFKRKYNSI